MKFNVQDWKALTPLKSDLQMQNKNSYTLILT